MKRHRHWIGEGASVLAVGLVFLALTVKTFLEGEPWYAFAFTVIVGLIGLFLFLWWTDRPQETPEADYHEFDLYSADNLEGLVKELTEENARLRSGVPVPEAQHQRIIENRDYWVTRADKAETALHRINDLIGFENKDELHKKIRRLVYQGMPGLPPLPEEEEE